MLRDKDATIILRCKSSEFCFYFNEIEFKPHFYNEGWEGYRFIEFQWLWFLFCYEYDRVR